MAHHFVRFTMRLIPLAGLVAATLVTVTSAASAAIVVEVGNSGRGCYEATLTTPSLENNRSAVLACDLAVNTAAGEQARLAAFVNRSDIRLRVQDWAGAVSDAERAIAIDPELAAAHLNRGAGMVGLKRNQEALAVFDQALALKNDRPELVYYDRALARENLGDLKGAYVDYRKALDANPKFQPAADELTRFKVTTR
jgi:tetratricopeptide (TPR) repeat protein